MSEFLSQDIAKMPRCSGLTVPYPIHSGNRSVRHSGGRHYLSAETQAYRTAVALAAQRHGLYAARMGERGALLVEVLAVPPDKRARDHTNLMKTLEDALTHAGVWVDDSNKVIRKVVFEWAPADRLCKAGLVNLMLTEQVSANG